MRLLTLLIFILFTSLSLTACGGSSSKSAEAEKVETGSLMRSFKLIDDQGREAGTLVLNPFGGAELRDANGKVVGSFTSAGPPKEAPK